MPRKSFVTFIPPMKIILFIALLASAAYAHQKGYFSNFKAHQKELGARIDKVGDKVNKSLAPTTQYESDEARFEKRNNWVPAKK